MVCLYIGTRPNTVSVSKIRQEVPKRVSYWYKSDPKIALLKIIIWKSSVKKIYPRRSFVVTFWMYCRKRGASSLHASVLHRNTAYLEAILSHKRTELLPPSKWNSRFVDFAGFRVTIPLLKTFCVWFVTFCLFVALTNVGVQTSTLFNLFLK